MSVLYYTLVVLITFVVMEGLTWLSHKYVMHGLLWYLHEDHHRPKYDHTFEKNDAFFVIGALPSILLFVQGLDPVLNFKFFVALGMLLYGVAYFLVHDVLIHRRFSWFDNTNNRYLVGLRKAHKVHHKNMGKEGGVNFGMLHVSRSYFSKKSSR